MHKKARRKNKINSNTNINQKPVTYAPAGSPTRIHVSLNLNFPNKEKPLSNILTLCHEER